MKRKSLKANLVGAAISGVLLLALSGCATAPPNYITHGFSFHTMVEGQNASVLDYSYGQRGAGINGEEPRVRPGHPISQHGQFGPMLRGEELYVKWQDRESGQVYERRIDLRGKLPTDLKGCVVTFQVFGGEIFVYVVTPQKRDPHEPPVGPPSERHRKVLQVYP